MEKKQRKSVWWKTIQIPSLCSSQNCYGYLSHGNRQCRDGNSVGHERKTKKTFRVRCRSPPKKILKTYSAKKEFSKFSEFLQTTCFFVVKKMSFAEKTRKDARSFFVFQVDFCSCFFAVPSFLCKKAPMCPPFSKTQSTG